MGISRRQLIGSIGAVAATSMLPEGADAQVVRRKPSLRIAHLTDIHVQPEKKAALGMERALEHAQRFKPDLILFGGDLIMDALAVDYDRMRAQWEIFTRVARANVGTAAEYIIGNHDVWGWNQPTVYKSELGYGKRYAMDVLELEVPYRSFDRGGWHIILLDSTHPKTVGYTAKLDEKQFAWLADDLARTPKSRPVMVCSHIPILSPAAFLDGDNETSGNWRVPGAWMHIDARRIKDLFKKHPNVKLCVSGHLHMVDSCRYLGISYHCNGAVSGGWWNGDYQEFKPGYALIDLYSDGWFFNRFIPYGWTPQPA